MINQVDLQRLGKIKQDIALLQLRFPIATIAKRTGLNKGNISKALRGKVPCSDNLMNRFYVSFREDLDNARSNCESKQEFDRCPVDTSRSKKLIIIASTLTELAAIINQIA